MVLMRKWGEAVGRERGPLHAAPEWRTWDRSSKPAAFPLLVPVAGTVKVSLHLVGPQNLLGGFVAMPSLEPTDRRPTGSGTLSVSNSFGK